MLLDNLEVVIDLENIKTVNDTSQEEFTEVFRNSEQLCAKIVKSNFKLDKRSSCLKNDYFKSNERKVDIIKVLKINKSEIRKKSRIKENKFYNFINKKFNEVKNSKYKEYG